MSESHYIPYPFKRFKISDDKYSQARIAMISKVRQELENEWQLPIGFVLYGSLTKGRILNKDNHANADIDFSIFVILDEVDLVTYVAAHEIQGDLSCRKLIGNAIRSSAKEKFKREGLTDRQLENIWVYPVTKAFWDQTIDKIKPTNRDWTSQELQRDFQESVYLYPIVRLFMLDIGNKLTDQKLYILHTLKSMGDYGKLIWDYLISHIKDQERQDNLTYHVSSEYPDTLDEAIRKYSNNDWMRNKV